MRKGLDAPASLFIRKLALFEYSGAGKSHMPPLGRPLCAVQQLAKRTGRRSGGRCARFNNWQSAQAAARAAVVRGSTTGKSHMPPLGRPLCAVQKMAYSLLIRML
jgi:hypothetical protein